MGELKLVFEIPELGELMSRVDDLQADVAALSTKLDEAKGRISEDVQALRDQLASAQIDDAKLTEINATVDGLQATVDGIDPDPSNPPAADPVPPEA